jgi:type I restriction enzyme R subunit
VLPKFVDPLRDHIDPYKRLAQLYATVRNAYADKVGFVADLAYKTKRLVEQNAAQEGLGRLTKSVTFDVKTLEALRGEKGSDEGKVFNLVRAFRRKLMRTRMPRQCFSRSRIGPNAS